MMIKQCNVTRLSLISTYCNQGSFHKAMYGRMNYWDYAYYNIPNTPIIV